MEVPAIGHTMSRNLMPQIHDPHDFLDELELQGISHGMETLDPSTLKSTQSEFDANKVYKMMSDKGEKRPIITSKDGYVLDGHHRWLEAHNKGEKIEAHVCDAPILDLLMHARRYVKLGIGLNEEIEHKDFGPMLDSFVSFASEKLGLKSLPNIRFKGPHDKFNSFAAYSPGRRDIVVTAANRHPMDVFRSVAHELVHQHQDERGALYDGAGETGSPIEDEANYLAGRIMRLYARDNPHHFSLTHVKEHAILFGGPCSGKDRIARYLNEKHDVNVLSMDTYDADAIKEQIKNVTEHFGEPLVLFVETTNDVSKARNEARAAKGQRVLAEGVRFQKFIAANIARKTISEEYPVYIIDNSVQINEGKNDVTVKVKVEQPKAAAKKKSSSSAASDKPKKKVVRKSQAQVKMDMEAQKQRFAMTHEKTKQKFAQDNEERKLAHERESQARQMQSQAHQARALEFQQKLDTIRQAMSRLQPAGPNFKAIHGALKKQMAGAVLGMRKYQKQAADLYALPKPNAADPAKAINEAFQSLFEEGGAGEEATDKLRATYQQDTPGQEKPIEPVPVPNTVPDDGIGAQTITNLPPWPGGSAGIGGYSGLAEDILAWAKSPNTIARFKSRYGDLYEQKILETAHYLDAQKVGRKPRTLSDMQESFDKGIGLMGTVPNQGKDEIEEDGCPENNDPINTKKVTPKRKN